MTKLIFYRIRWLLIVVLMTTNATADTNLVTFDSLVAEVLEKNPELKFYQAEVAAAKGSRKTAGLWTNLEFSGSLGQKRIWNRDDELTGKGNAGELVLRIGADAEKIDAYLAKADPVAARIKDRVGGDPSRVWRLVIREGIERAEKSAAARRPKGPGRAGPKGP